MEDVLGGSTQFTMLGFILALAVFYPWFIVILGDKELRLKREGEWLEDDLIRFGQMWRVRSQIKILHRALRHYYPEALGLWQFPRVSGQLLKKRHDQQEKLVFQRGRQWTWYSVESFGRIWILTRTIRLFKWSVCLLLFDGLLLVVRILLSIHGHHHAVFDYFIIALFGFILVLSCVIWGMSYSKGTWRRWWRASRPRGW